MPLNIHWPQPVSPTGLRKMKQILASAGLPGADHSTIEFAAENGLHIRIGQPVTARQEELLRQEFPTAVRFERPGGSDLMLRIRARDIGALRIQLADILEAHGRAPDKLDWRATGDDYWAWELSLQMVNVPDVLRDDLYALLEDRMDVAVDGLDPAMEGIQR